MHRRSGPGSVLALRLVPALLVALVAAPTAVGFAAGASRAGAVVPTVSDHAPPLPAAREGRLGPVAIPFHVPSHPPRLSRKASVSPTAYYGAEPAPMGIADFGVDGSGNGYTYQTAAFYGTTDIRSLGVYNSQLVSQGAQYQMTIQLNVVLTFDQGGSTYEYWVQDVAFLDTHAKEATFENNIWNFSASGAGLDSQSVSGNGSVYSDEVYIAGVDSTLPGANVTYSTPFQLGLEVWAKIANNVPEVVFQYRDGHGLVTYDNAEFPFARGATDVNFTVDGTNYNPLGLFNDAELVLGGPGNGYGTTATAANLSMALAYYNGRNFQAVPNAFDFGSDTAEAISAVVPSFGSYTANGSLADNLTYGSSGSLHNLYNDSFTGSAEIETLATGGELEINGTAPIPFTAAPVNLSLAPGNYTFEVWVHGTLEGESTQTIRSGQNLVIYIDAGTVSTLTFAEVGLPTGHLWNISFDGQTHVSAGTAIQFSTLNGSFGWHLGTTPGWQPNVSSGSVLIQGSDANVSIGFAQVFYAVTLLESGLPSGTSWEVTVDNTSYSSSTSEIALRLPNGSFAYTLGFVPGYTGTPAANGTIEVNGGEVLRTIQYRVFTYAVVFEGVGLPVGQLWGVEVNGSNVSASVPQAIAELPNGSFSYAVHPPTGWIASPRTGSVDVRAADLFVNISFHEFTFAIAFNETGLAAGAVWGVQIGRVHLTTANATILFEEPNGSGTYQVDSVLGYLLLTPDNASYFVNGLPQNISVTYEPAPAIVGTLEGSFTPTDAVLLINDSEVATPGGRFDLSMLPGAYGLEISLAGYRPYFTNVTISAGALVILQPITLQPLGSTSPHGTTGSGGGGGGTGTLGAFGTLDAAEALLVLGIAAAVVIAVALARRGRSR